MVWFSEDIITLSMRYSNFLDTLKSSPLFPSKSSPNSLHFQERCVQVMVPYFEEGGFISRALSVAESGTHVMVYNIFFFVLAHTHTHTHMHEYIRTHTFIYIYIHIPYHMPLFPYIHNLQNVFFPLGILSRIGFELSLLPTPHICERAPRVRLDGVIHLLPNTHTGTLFSLLMYILLSTSY